MGSYELEDFFQDARKPVFVGFLVWIGLGGLGLVFPTIWAFVFPMLLGFVIFDIVLNEFVRGRKIPLSQKGHEYKPKGWVFGAYLTGILVASVLSAVLSEWIVIALNDPSLGLGIRLFSIFVANSFVVLVLWFDFETKVWNAK